MNTKLHPLVFVHAAKAILAAGLILFQGQSLFGREYYVDCRSVAASENGEAQTPFKTIQKAADAARAGDVVIVRAGVYREGIVLTQGGSPSAPIIFKAMPAGSVIVDGAAPLVGLEREPTASGGVMSVWVSRSYEPRTRKLPAALRKRWMGQGEIGQEQVRRCERTDMIWLDGRRLDEVVSRGALVPGSYWIDREKGGLYLALSANESPAEHCIEAGERDFLLKGIPGCSYVHIKGFRFMRATTPFQASAVEIGTRDYSGPAPIGVGKGWVFENNTVCWNNYSGISFHGQDHVLLGNIVEYNGNSGINGSRSQNILLDGNTSRLNNWKGIRTGFEGGGGKITVSDGVTVRNHVAAYNIGPGIWFDIENKNIHIENCRVHHNMSGIFIEISPGPARLNGNLCYANGEAGIMIGESSNVLVEDNILTANRDGVELRNMLGREDRANGWKWQLSNISIRDNVISENMRSGIVNTMNTIDIASARVQSDRNVFWRNPPVLWKAPGANVRWEVGDPAFLPPVDDERWVFETVEKAAQKLGLEKNSVIKNPDYGLAFIYEYPWPQAGPASAVRDR